MPTWVAGRIVVVGGIDDSIGSWNELTPEQRQHELVLQEVSDVLTNLDFTIGRARKALKIVRKLGPHGRAQERIEEALSDLLATRKRLVQGTYYAVDDDSLF